MVVTDNKILAEKIRNLSVFGMTSAWDREKSDKFIIPEFTEVGYNYKMSDIIAAVGVAQLGKLDKIIERKRELAKYWETLMNRGIQTQIGTYASHIQPVYNSNQKCPNSLEIFNRSLALPMYYMLEEKDIDIAAVFLKKTLDELK
jgi:dTDP-4-amino-4,6-dideoxygalactose transaminase